MDDSVWDCLVCCVPKNGANASKMFVAGHEDVSGVMPLDKRTIIYYLFICWMGCYSFSGYSEVVCLR